MANLTRRPTFGIATDLQPLLRAQKAAPEWIKIFPFGRWERGDGDIWEITPQAGADFVKHFDERVLVRDVPFDIQHERGLAPGWIEALEARADGVWARVRWTPSGKSLVENEEYRYVSPEWFWTYERAGDGATFQHVLSRVALTNDPFFVELPAIAVAENCTAFERRDDRLESLSHDNGGGMMPQTNDNDTGRTDDQVTQDTQRGGNATGAPPADGGRLGGRPPAGGDKGNGASRSDAATRPGSLPAGEGGDRLESLSHGGDNAQAGAAGAAAVMAQRVQALEAQLATERAERLAMARREERTSLAVALRSELEAVRPGQMLPPAIADGLADLLVDVSDQAPPVQGQLAEGQEAPKSKRATLRALLVAVSKPWPMRGEMPHLEPPQEGTPTDDAAKSELLDKLATERAAKDVREGVSDGTKYADAVRAVVAERPDLR